MEPTRLPPTDGMTPLDYGQQMYIPDVQPMVDLNVPIPAVGTVDSAEGSPIGGPFLNG
jgi:hypothetical protein